MDIITRLMERLLEYRSIINDESKENRMNCIVNLLVGVKAYSLLNHYVIILFVLNCKCLK